MKIIDEKLLHKYYYDNKLPMIEISRRFFVCKRTILDRLKKLKFEPREKISFLIDDLTDKKISNLTFLKYVKNDKFGKAMWLCRCDCGKEKILNASAIKAYLTTSCGCNKQKALRKGYELISGSFWKKLKKSALIRSIDFDISIEDAWQIYIEQDRKCAITGVDISMYPESDKLYKQTASPDRINSDKGYTKDNFQWVHKRVNRLKSVLSMDELLFWASLIVSCNKNKPIKHFDTSSFGWENEA